MVENPFFRLASTSARLCTVRKLDDESNLVSASFELANQVGGVEAWRVESLPAGHTIFPRLNLGRICDGEYMDDYWCARKLANVCFLDLTIQDAVNFHYVE